MIMVQSEPIDTASGEEIRQQSGPPAGKECEGSGGRPRKEGKARKVKRWRRANAALRGPKGHPYLLRRESFLYRCNKVEEVIISKPLGRKLQIVMSYKNSIIQQLVVMRSCIHSKNLFIVSSHENLLFTFHTCLVLFLNLT